MTKHFFGEAQGDEKEEDKRGCLCLASRETRVEHQYVHETSQTSFTIVYNIKSRDFHLRFGLLKTKHQRQRHK